VAINPHPGFVTIPGRGPPRLPATAGGREVAMPSTGWGRGGQAGLAWGLWALTLLGLGATMWLASLLRRDGYPPLAPLLARGGPPPPAAAPQRGHRGGGVSPGQGGGAGGQPPARPAGRLAAGRPGAVHRHLRVRLLLHPLR